MTETQTEETYLIEAAAEYVGLSRRTFERMNISSSTERRQGKDGKMRDMRVYTKSVLDEVKTNLKAPKHKPEVVVPTNANTLAPVVAASDLPALAQLLFTKITEANPKLLAAPAEEKAPKKKTVDFSQFKDKLILNFTQAHHLSGLTTEELNAALENGNIKATFTEKTVFNKKFGREVARKTYKISRPSLEEYCTNLFN